MYLNKIKVKNYRSLKDVELVLDKENGTPNLSLIIGKNNSGKTSLLKIMKKMIVEDRKLSWDDFNIQYRKEIHKILVSEEERNEENIKGIILDLYMEYDDNDDLNNILPLMLDLNMENNIVVLEFRCQPIIHKIEELRNLGNGTELKEYRKFSDFMQENLNKYFETNVYARGYDYRSCELTDAIEKLDSSIVKKIINITGISAKRDTSNNEKDHTLSQIAAKYYENFSDEEDKIRSLREEVNKTDGVLNEEYNKLFKDVIDDFEKFGNNGKGNVNIHSKMDVSKLLKGNTVFSYQYNEEDLPENYNGLGYMNLLGIIFEVKVCFQKFRQDSNRSKINILYIEEPEAHTHPQLQYIFIKNIGKLIENEKENLNVQTIITTHSSHIVSQCKFEDTNFFIKENDNAQIKSYADLENLYKNEREVFEFVKKYITLSRAEIFFADKLILIEGDTERILLPTMMERVDNKNNEEDVLPLLSQNISVLVIGNHAHVLSKLISFLNLKTLVITDIDAKRTEEKGFLPKDAKETTNGSLKKFFKGKSFEGLMNLKKDEKILSIEVKTEDRDKDDVEYKEDPSGNLRIAYQIEEKNSKEESYQATSFEDSFIHLNLEFVQKLANEHRKNAGLKNIEKINNVNNVSYELASNCIDSKTNFAIGVLMYGNNKWQIPKYIEEGLEWIRK